MPRGPAVDATAVGLPVLVGNLAHPGRLAQWPLFVREASGLGIAAVFAVPLRIGAISLGVLVAHRGTAGDLGTWELSRLMMAADEAADLALDTAVDPGTGTPNALQDLGSAEIHQASGMVMVQLGVPIEAALARLRAYAFAEDRSVAEVARDVVSRLIRFEP
ncbi:ANTAR domain-containing protein [Microlunatus sp. GCM10028923]|uniref:ANTAR domain-containing protein n=1 Tax=Microlunatus sp. GCM10028923 TaxID=3273400 RepID=UPI00361DDBDF